MQDYEQLGAFYLGRRFDPESGSVTTEPLLYDARDLTTHAVCVGMTGSGKSGLGVALIEEAAIDGIPVIVIDPKGDMGNLLLTFPELSADDFLPWMDAADAARKGRTVQEHAQATAKMWRQGLGEWGQGPDRVRRYADAAERVIYTPGSRAGRPLTILRSFDAPAPAILNDEDALRERIMSSASGLLALLGIDPDPIRSREHILLSNLLDRTWREGRSLDLPGLIRAIQNPPFQRVGVFDLESFFPANDRLGFAMTINNLLASPGFAAWAEGDPLDINRLLYTEEGRPKVSILSIAHLSDHERMSFVTLLLGEVIAWMRAQPGSRTLRAMLYMDEVFGYFPPVANPPSKQPMLTLLKQARAFGLGTVLATQNPVDLDYKGLSNAGTWFIGRLQTERDKERVLEGLEGASASAGAGFDRAAMERTLAGLGSRVFLMNNVHEDAPVLFHTRWVLSYLAGPMTREQIRGLSSAAPASSPQAPDPQPVPAGRPAPTVRRVVPQPSASEAARPQLPAGIEEGFLPPRAGNGAPLYRPALLAETVLHYVNASAKVDEWKKLVLLAPLDEDSVARPWDEAETLDGGLPFIDDDPDEGIGFADLPAPCSRAASYTRWEKMLKTALYRGQPMRLLRCRKLKLVSLPEEDEGGFRGRMRDAVREQRDMALEKLRKRYGPKLGRLEERIRTAEQRVEKEQAQYRDQQAQVAVSVGTTLLGALFGRKVRSAGTVGRAASTVRRAGRAVREKGDIGRAMETLEARRQDLADLEAEFEEALEDVRSEIDIDAYEVEEVTVNPRKSDIGIDRMLLVWVP